MELGVRSTQQGARSREHAARRTQHGALSIEHEALINFNLYQFISMHDEIYCFQSENWNVLYSGIFIRAACCGLSAACSVLRAPSSVLRTPCSMLRSACSVLHAACSVVSVNINWLLESQRLSRSHSLDWASHWKPCIHVLVYSSLFISSLYSTVYIYIYITVLLSVVNYT